MFLHVFDLLIFNRSALGFCCLNLALTRIVTESLILDNLILFDLTFCKEAEEQSVNHQVWITADRGGEVGIVFKSQTKMANI